MATFALSSCYHVMGFAGELGGYSKEPIRVEDWVPPKEKVPGVRGAMNPEVLSRP